MTEKTTLLNTRDAAKYLGISIQSLRTHKLNGTGPAFTPLGPGGGKIRYTENDLEDWLSSRRVQQTKTKGKLTHIKG